MKIAVIGYGLEGRAAEKYWKAKGADVEIRDISLGADYLEHLNDFDIIIRSPGIRPDQLTSRGIDPLKISSSTQEVLRHSPAPIIGVTGTKGKGTTATLIAKILATAGKRVWLGGNIGRPAYDFLPEVKADDVVVLELSSFQLMDITRSPHIAVCVMIAPEHLDWHLAMNEYTEAKGNIFRFQRPGDLAVYKNDDINAAKLAGYSHGEQVGYGAEPGAVVHNGFIMIDEIEIIKTSEIALIGPHNLENICAAVTATWKLVNNNPLPIRQVIAGFTGLPHRLQLTREFNAVRYYDDSFATTPETTIAAINAFAGPKLLILGGSDKGVTYGALAQAVQDGNVIHALLIGDMAPVIAAELRAVGFEHFTEVLWAGMPALVELCRKLTEPGDVVLLSPGCASFGLFKDYKDRAQQYNAAVKALT
jgi:UDP-N-acetylmuramoylalanine--D-glutamate ligase